jgi:hypothetical protein
MTALARLRQPPPSKAADSASDDDKSRSGRRLWEESENLQLMKLWPLVNSVAVIAILMRRSLSSVQTQASRLGLPPRNNERDRNRKKWADGDDLALDAALEDLRSEDGKIDITKVADHLGRSIDAVVARIEMRFGAESEVIKCLSAPPPPNVPFLKKSKGRFPGEIACLRTYCQRKFWSPGPWKRICNHCKRNDDSGMMDFEL